MLGKKMSMKDFEEKITLYYQQTVRVYLPRDVLKLCETPNQFIEYVGLMNWIMKLPACDRNDEERRHNTKIRKK